MLGMFNIHAPAPSPASSTSIPTKATAGSGAGYTPDDPIQIDSSDEPNSGLMLITYTPGETVEELKEEREGLLSIIAPRYPPSSSLALMLSTTTSTGPLNPLTGSPERTPLSSSTFPAAFTLPPLEMQFRKLVDTLPSFASSSPSSSGEETLVPSCTSIIYLTTATCTSSPNGKDKGRSGRKPAQKTKEELAKEKEVQAQFSADLALLEKRMKLWSLNDAVESGTIPTSVLTLTATTKSKSSAKAKAKSILKALGVGINAATCAYTSVLPKAPFWACVKVSTPATLVPGMEVDATEVEMVGVRETTPTPSSGGKKMNASSKKQKAAALGPKRKPKNAPAASAAPAPSISTSTFLSFSITSLHAKSKNGHGHSKAKSNSSLSSSSSSETGTDSRPHTPVDGMDIPSMPLNITRKAAFPLAGFTAVSPNSFALLEVYGVNVDISTPISVPVKQTQISAPRPLVAAPIPAAPTPTPVQPSALAVAAPASVPSAPAPSQIPRESQPQPQMQMHMLPLCFPTLSCRTTISVSVHAMCSI
ncbi:hypothetical protein BT96DRAFT_1005709 [Gymnopus androsaceus JB14]|uniref:Uncharacterized protein n=1 Tax=Gymnopus androsaceus JB14 TaxID=1447944 RepID=A0A6A4GNP5_9AGAR|nr:hypothetical protein BT96DRAFT_1005709 [Gymnopus androsaceus JB14]